MSHQRYQVLKYSPTICFGNTITILSGKIMANNDKNGLRFLNSLSTDLWLIFILLLSLAAICSEIIHRNYSIYLFFTIINRVFKFLTQFLNQSQQYFSFYCCSKHFPLKACSLIAITIMTLFFTSNLFSNLVLFNYLKIETIDELVRFLKENDHVRVMADNQTQTWKLLRTWEEPGPKFVTKKIENVSFRKFDLKSIYEGKAVALAQEFIFQSMIAANPQLTFHLSSGQFFAIQYGYLYNKYIDNDVKRGADKAIRMAFECGVSNRWLIEEFGKRANASDDNSHDSMSVQQFVPTMILFGYLFVTLLILFILEIISAKSIEYLPVQSVPRPMIILKNNFLN